MEGGWEAYFYPGTEVLRNRRGLRDADELADFERHATAVRLAELAAVELPGRYDLAHLRAFHGHLFQDVYDWAGELRTVELAKDASPFCRREHIESYSHGVFARLASEQRLQGLDHKAFVERLAHYLGEVNAIHPFREGNGRAQRAFFSQLARETGRHLAWERIDAQRNIDACRAAHRGDERPLRALLSDITDQLGHERGRALEQRVRAARQRGRGGRQR